MCPGAKVLRAMNGADSWVVPQGPGRVLGSGPGPGFWFGSRVLVRVQGPGSG